MTPELRLAVLEWARRHAAGELEGLAWVDGTVVPDGMPYTIARDGESVRFRHVPYGRFLPSPMTDAAIDAQERGEVPALEALMLLFARTEWLVAARAHLFAPYGPVPALLASLVEAYGVDAEIHGFDGDTLARALAVLPTWHPYRGDPERAGWLLEDALGIPHGVDLDQTPRAGLTEAFACRSASWYAHHGVPEGDLTVSDDLVWANLAKPPSGGPEDVLVGWVPGGRIPHQLLRLLPAWGSIRLHHKDGAPPIEATLTFEDDEADADSGAAPHENKANESKA